MYARAILLSIASGAIFGAAWRDLIPAFLGVLGLGLFFRTQQWLCGKHWLLRTTMAWLTGFTAFAIACFWVMDTAKYLLETERGWVIAPVAILVWTVHAFPFVLFAILFPFSQRLRHPLYVMPPLWLLCELLSPSLFPFPVGCLLVDLSWVAQPAEIGGVSLLSLIAACYALLFCGILDLLPRRANSQQPRMVAKKSNRRNLGKKKHRKKDRLSRERSAAIAAPSFANVRNQWRGGVLATTLVFSLLWGALRNSQIEEQDFDGRSLDILIVQADTAHARANTRMLRATGKVAGKADLVLWPECSIGSFEQSLTSFADMRLVSAAAKDKELHQNPVGSPATPLLIGGDSWQSTAEGDRIEEYVSAYLVDRGGAILGRHDKVNLMPYGESIPGEGVFPFLRSCFGSPRKLTRGDSIHTIGTVGGVRLGTVLCCEDMYPDLCRGLIADGAEALVSLANGIAFQSSVALQQHFRIARCRAIENRRYLVRCASRGISAVVTPAGAVKQRLPVFEDCAQVVRIRGSRFKTIFSRFGMLPVALATLLMLGATLPFKSRSRRE